jgi:hypothetical protein
LGLSYTAMGSCPPCQAGSCTDCTNQTGCSWYTHSGPLSATCSSNTTVPPTPSGIPGTYSKLGTCPACKDTNDCATCNMVAIGTTGTNCSWYVLPGSTGGKCAEASPGFAYSKVSTSFCGGGNPCGGVDTCVKCQAVNATLANNSMGNPCVWLQPKPSFTAFYNSKCDYDIGSFDTTFYTSTVGTCPICTGTSCVTCKAESGCKWSAVDVGGLLSFGQCLKSTDTTPTGKSDIGTCPAACQLYSCAQCTANTDCRWFTGSQAGLDDTCDRGSDINQHPFTTVIGGGVGTCPPCKSSRCFECNNEPSGCGWYVNTFPGVGGDIPGSGDCAMKHTASSTERLVPNTDKKCDGASGAGSLYPSLVAFVVAIFVYHN